MRRGPAGLATVLSMIACVQQSDGQGFVADVVYDTLAEVGHVDEDNPLLIYQDPLFPQLVADRVVVYADRKGGRLVAVDLVDGSGWEVDDEGGHGPGEFSGVVPWFGESGGLVFSASQRGQAATWSLNGELLATRRYEGFISDHPGTAFPVGMMDGGVLVAHFEERVEETPSGELVHRQGIRAYAPERGLIWEYDDFPSAIYTVSTRSDGRTGASLSAGGGFIIDARHNSVAIVRHGEPWLRVLGHDGGLRGRIELAHPAVNTFVDADERIWVEVVAAGDRKRRGSYLVFDSDLSGPRMHVVEKGVQDARGEYLLTRGKPPGGLAYMHLLRMRPR